MLDYLSVSFHGFFLFDNLTSLMNLTTEEKEEVIYIIMLIYLKCMFCVQKKIKVFFLM